MRRLGVYGENLPTKKERTVSGSNFSACGLIAKCDRRYGKAMAIGSVQEAQAVFGLQTNSAWFGWDAINGFFANLRGKPGSLYVVSPVGTSAAVATVSIVNRNSAPAAILQIQAAYQTDLEYSLSGNRTGYTLEVGASFTVGAVTLPTGSGAPARVITLASVVGIKVGDILHLHSTIVDEYHYVTAVDEGVSTVTWADADYSGSGVAADYTVTVVAMKIHIWRKDTKGVVTEVDTLLGKRWVTINTGDPDKLASAVFAVSSWAKVSVLSPAAVIASLAIPAAVTTVTYLSGGLDGTGQASAADWAPINILFNSLPVRFLANAETVVATVQKALEVYCRGRDDNPIVILAGAMTMTKALAIAAGQGFQRSDEVDAIFVHNWLYVADPFASSGVSPYRAIPAVGHLMGFAVSGIAELGVHAIPAWKGRALLGVADVVGEQGLDDQDRTDMADAGVNVIQNVSGRGIIVRNWFTPSTAVEFKYGNSLLMRNYIKVSVVDSLQDSENTPNDIGHVREDKSAFMQFMTKLWLRGSNGNIKEGETFGQYEAADGKVSTKEDAFEIVADATNNDVATLQAGERNLDCWFMFPAPAGSIKIGVGIMYKTA